MTDVKFYRKKNIITAINGTVQFIGKITVNKMEIASINAAKRESRKLQAIHGQGSVRVQS